MINQVRAGQAFRPRAWKGNARCTVALSFDSDHGTNELRDGGKSIGRLCWGQFGNRVGVPRIMSLLRRHGIRATFFVPAVSALSRIWILEEIIRYAKSKGDVWFATHAEVAAWAKEHPA